MEDMRIKNEVVFHKLNFYSLIACILAPKTISCEQALNLMGAKPASKPYVILNKKTGNKSNLDLENIKYLYYEKEEDLKAIGKLYNCSAPTISRFLKASGLKARKQGCTHNKKESV